jgi:hypothetical protein
MSRLVLRSMAATLALVLLFMPGCQRDSGATSDAASRVDDATTAAGAAAETIAVGMAGPAVPRMDDIEVPVLERASTHPLPTRFDLGQPASSAHIARLDIDVMPDGRGLPAGSGSVDEGARLFAANCAVCHGVDGIGGPEGSLVGRVPGDAFDFGDGMRAERTIGSYWPWATTVFDYVRRAMPWDRPGSLSDDEVYAITAWLLYRNDIIAADAVLDATSLPQVEMPSRDRFVADDRLESHRVR